MKNVILVKTTGTSSVVINGCAPLQKPTYEYKDVDTGEQYIVHSPQEMIDKGATIISQN